MSLKFSGRDPIFNFCCFHNYIIKHSANIHVTQVQQQSRHIQWYENEYSSLESAHVLLKLRKRD